MKKFFTNKHNRGFTLIEMLVYVAILGMVSGGALTLLFSMGDQINQGRVERLMTNTAYTALERMLHEIRAADLVDIYYSTLESSPGVLTLTQSASSTEFSVSSSTLFFAVDSVNQGPLTSEKVSVDDLRFYHYDNGVTELVRIGLTLTAEVGDVTLTRDFEAATVLRGSYD